MKLNIQAASDHALLELSFHRHFAQARCLKLRQRLEFSTRYPSVCTHSTRMTTRTAHSHERTHADIQLLRRRPLRSLNFYFTRGGLIPSAETGGNHSENRAACLIEQFKSSSSSCCRRAPPVPTMSASSFCWNFVTGRRLILAEGQKKTKRGFEPCGLACPAPAVPANHAPPPVRVGVLILQLANGWKMVGNRESTGRRHWAEQCSLASWASTSEMRLDAAVTHSHTRGTREVRLGEEGNREGG